MITLHVNGHVTEDSEARHTGRSKGEGTEMTVNNPAKHVCNIQVETIQNHREEVRKRREEEAYDRTQDWDLNSTVCLERLSQNSSMDIGHFTFDGMDVVKETKSASDEQITTGLADVFLSLQQLQVCLHDAESQEDVQLLMQLLLQTEFQCAFSMHHTLTQRMRHVCPPYPITAHAQRLREEVETDLQASKQTEATELTDLLTSPHLQALLEAHDCIAEQEFDVESNDVQYGKTVKLVCLEKARDMPLGVTVRNEHDRVMVSRVVRGGIAEKSSLLSEGDEILEINGIPVRGKSVNDVHNILSIMHGPLTFLLIPNSQNKLTPHSQSVMHVKAYFNYDPSDDPFVPCRELGLSFQQGDVLHVISQDDPNWWQAYRDGDKDHQPLAGLIPGKSFQQQREAIKKTITDRNQEHRGKLLYAKKIKKQRKKLLYNSNKNIEHYSDDILTYEEVTLYHQPPNQKRPIALIGPPNSGQDELRQRLMSLHPTRFTGAVPHTTRAPRTHELNGREYHFVSRQNFEADLNAGKFIESGEFERNLYGTNTDSVRQIINSGRVCLLCLHPRSLQVLRSSDLKPYVIFIRPPLPHQERLPSLLSKGGKKHTPVDVREISEKTREMEQKYGNLFDAVITNSDQDQSVSELLRLADKLDTEPQWLPSAWLR